MVRKAIALTILITIILSTSPLTSYAEQSKEYYENITLYVIGKNVLIRYNFTGTNIGIIDPQFLREKFSGIDYFRFYISQFDMSSTEITYFNGLGYNILLCNSTVPNIATLYIHSKTFQEANKFAEEIENLTGLSFISYGKDGEMFVFISPASFTDVLENFVWQTVPISYGGFTHLLNKKDILSSKIKEFGVIGKFVDGRLYQSIVVNILKTNIYSGNMLRSGLDIFLITRVNSSTDSKLSSLKIISYGQVIEKSDTGYVRSKIDKKVSELTLTIPGNNVLHFPNITLSIGTPSIIVQREISKTALKFGEEFEVQIKIRNVGTYDAEDINFEDRWWIENGKFTLTVGKYSDKISRLGPGENYTTVYRLKVQSKDTDSIYVKPLETIYFWNVAGEKVSFRSYSNDAHVLLNQDAASVYVLATTSSSKVNFGTGRETVLEIKNKGSLTAFDIVVGGEKIANLLPQESVKRILRFDLDNVSQPFKEEVIRCQWNDGKEIKSSVSNNIMLTNTYGKVGITILSLEKEVKQISLKDKILLNLTLYLKSFGAKDAYNITILEKVPKGLKYVNGTFTLKEEKIYLFEGRIAANSSKTYTYLLEVEDYSKNYVLEPAYAEYIVGSQKYASLSTLEGIPIGLKIIIYLEDTEVFQNYNVSGYYAINNFGDKGIYRVSAQLVYGKPLNITTASSINKTIIKSGSQEKVFFTVNGREVGLNNSIFVKTKYFFGGKQYIVNSTKKYINVYHLPKIAFSTEGDTIEGKPFEIKIIIKNDTPLKIEKVQFNITVPAQIKIVENLSPSTAKIIENIVKAEIGALEGGREEIIVLKMLSSSAREYTISTSEILFNYKGEVLKTEPQTIILRVSDDLVSRYIIPLIITIIIMIIGKIAIGIVKKR
ncbi:MAG: hypothetical protein N3F64_00375 [Nitrososphaeria archaeon]|nr:hypothetical protein [Nitrososphaeria archaeon]